MSFQEQPTPGSAFIRDEELEELTDGVTVRPSMDEVSRQHLMRHMHIENLFHGSRHLPNPEHRSKAAHLLNVELERYARGLK